MNTPLPDAHDAIVDRAVAQVDCPDYSGSRLAQHAFESKINGKSIAELRAMEAADLAEWSERVDAPRVASQAASVRAAREDDPPLGLRT